MQGYITDEQDDNHKRVFSEGLTASQYLERYLPNDGDRAFFGYNEETEEWVQVFNRNGRLWIEIGEAAA